MTTIEDIKKLLESKSFTSARDLDEFEELPCVKLVIRNITKGILI